MDYQAVILAGGSGSRMYPLTNGPIGKHFLPIANRPLISYQIELLEKTLFQNVIVIITESYEELFTNYLSNYKGTLKISHIVVEDKLGTAEAIIKAKHLLTTDFVVVSGDVIIDPSCVPNMIDIHRTKDAAITILAKHSPNLNEYQDFIGLEDVDGSTNLKKIILYHSSSLNDSSSIQIPRSTLVNHPNITINNKILDTHFYIFSHWVLDIMESVSDPKSIRISVIPNLLHLQNEKRNIGDLISDNIPKEALTDPLETAHSMSTKLIGKNHKFDCYMYLVDSTKYCGRANTSKSFMEINRDVAKGITSYSPLEPTNSKGAYISKNALVDPQTTIGPQSIIGYNTVVGERCSVKHSVVGKNCKIASNVKIANSIILDNVTIESGAAISNSIVCSGVTLKKDCRISGSTIDYFAEVLAEGNIEKRIFKNDK